MGFEVPYWRAIAAYRVASLCYVTALVIHGAGHYAHPVGGWVVLGVMAVWTAYSFFAFPPVRARDPWPLLAADLLVAVGCLLATVWVDTDAHIAAGGATLPATWVAAPVVAWAVVGGKVPGLFAAVVISVTDLTVRCWIFHDRLDEATLNAPVLLLVVGVVIGHGGMLARAAQARLAQAVELEAANRERERLARGIHDSVLQVLALVQRRGAELGGDAAELGRLAGEQETALRALVGTGDSAETGGLADLRELLAGYSSTRVTVSVPATPVLLAGPAAREVTAAIGAAIDNVDRHCDSGARGWVLVEDDGREITVTIRDDGPGIAEGRLEEAERIGRLGVAQSIRGRVHDLGGVVTITSEPGEGTEVELRVPVG
jgi:signal transduction histidine kinase